MTLKLKTQKYYGANKSMTTPIIFFGNERIATGVSTDLPVIKTLIESGHTIECIIVNQSKHHYGRTKRELEIETFAREMDIELYVPDSNEALLRKVQQSESKVAVLVAYGKIITQEVIDAFEYGIVNLHPSLLPKYRGTTPLESFILSGDAKTGVSIMQLAKGMDDGPLYKIEEVTPERYISKQDLADLLLHTGAEMIKDIVPALYRSQITAQQQHGEPTITKPITKQDGTIDTGSTAEVIEREIRAYEGWPGAIIEKDGTRLKITKAHTITQNGTPGTFFVYEKQLAFYCAQDAIVIDTLQPEGKKQMASHDYLLGHPLV